MPASSTRKTRPRNTSPRAMPAPVLGDEPEFEPLHFTTDQTAEPEDRVTIAYVDDYPITMPKVMPPNVALKVMRTSRKRGDEIAMAEMLEEVIGDEAYLRLANHRGLTDGNLADLLLVVQKVAMGALEVPKASSGNG